jgi:hypothetical protein
VGEIGASGNGVADGSGMRNTKIIVDKASFIEQGFFGTSKKPAPTAARLCLESNHNGFTDWYLPTCSELRLMYENLKEKNNFKLFSGHCWSSSENPNYSAYSSGAWYLSFYNGIAYNDYKNYAKRVRAVRAFTYSTIK